MTRFGLNVERSKPKEQPEELSLADQLLDRLIGDAADLFGQLRLGQAQRPAALADAVSQTLGIWGFGGGFHDRPVYTRKTGGCTRHLVIWRCHKLSC